MMLSSRVAVALFQAATLIYLCTPIALSQIHQIDSSKLPPDAAVQHAYTDLLPIDQFARAPETTWPFPTPKEEVSSRFSLALHTLQKAQQQAPDNKELQLFTGLVAHLAYNLDIEQPYPALDLLRPLIKEDFRAAWFLGIHQCQSNDPVGGMQQLLHIETSSASLPGAFWQDYASCAITANMPVHALRAYDKARKTPSGPPGDEQLEQLARDRIKPSSVTGSYSPHQAWFGEKTAGGVRSTSTVCGESFLTGLSFHVKLGDVVNGMCVVTIDTETYPSRYGPSSASLLLLTQTAKPGESLQAFAERVLKDPRYGAKTPLTGVQCPVATCLSFDITTNKLYKAEGGAHILAVFFQSEQPAYPSLRFETPQPLPKTSNNSGQPAPSRPQETLQRFNGTLYTLVTLDANHDIYPRARADFDDLLKSLLIDSK